ncbi:unnamed protein product [Plutella xylostella]|uniref:(diamondback moth) hypothetical protein n=1 Tax=Plutella xylostella TaxID=51655 RepID=A0A8S4EGU3_PLUXY|nr:unnamed protein product [Plutella xylostella]
MSLTSKLVLTTSFIIVLTAVYFQDRIGPLYENIKSFIEVKVAKPANSELYSAEQLAQYNGIDNEALYLAILGVIFDVSKSSQHYSKGSSYHYFVGKDGSRSLISGNFSDTSADRDHVLDLTCDDIFVLMNWRDTFKQKYTRKGKLIGRYYDDAGEPTPYMKEVKSKIKNCKLAKQEAEEKRQNYPPCNMEWSVSDGTKVWCTKNSGGITREWTGVPRQLFTPGEDKPQCVCVDTSKDHSAALLKEYDNCQPTSTTCIAPSSP